MLKLFKIKEYNGIDAIIVASNILLVLFGINNYLENSSNSSDESTRLLNEINKKLDLLLQK